MVGRKLGVADRVLDVLVPEVVLQGARIVAVVGQLEPAGMAEHVRVDRPRVAVGALRPIDRPAPIALPIAIMAKWRNRQIGANCWTLGEVAPLDCQVYDAWGAFLGCRFHAGKPCLRVSYCIAYTPLLNSQKRTMSANWNEGSIATPDDLVDQLVHDPSGSRRSENLTVRR